MHRNTEDLAIALTITKQRYHRWVKALVRDELRRNMHQPFPLQVAFLTMEGYASGEIAELFHCNPSLVSKRRRLLINRWRSANGDLAECPINPWERPE